MKIIFDLKSRISDFSRVIRKVLLSIIEIKIKFLLVTAISSQHRTMDITLNSEGIGFDNS